jgi:hypothetical protein
MTSTTLFSEIPKLGRPADDEIEICLFGPSFGECILIHIGNNRWIVVDSCIYEGTAQPIALYYLDKMGLGPSVIENVLITHWHDDHSRGASAQVRSTPGARVWIAQTLTTPEFLRFALRMNKNKTAIAGPKLREFLAVIQQIRERRNAGETSFGFAAQNTLLNQASGKQFAHAEDVKFTALSPSHADQFGFLDRIADMLPRARQPKRSLGGPTPNEVSIASLLEIGSNSILLGADLENATPGSGWDAILSANRSSRFGARAHVYKIPHHGSLTAHNPQVWQEMLANDAIAILTPWRKGRGRLPDEDGIKAITKLSKDSFSSSRNGAGRPKNRNPAVQSYLRASNIQLRNLNASTGFIRMRKKPGADWQIELFGPACPLADLLRRRSRAGP